MVLSLSAITAIGQNNREIKADAKYEKTAYVDAIAIYTKLADKGYESINLYTKLGNANYFSAKYIDAAKWYGKLFDMTTDVVPEVYFRYSVALKAIDDIEKSNEYLMKFHQLNKSDSRGVMFQKNPNYIQEIDKIQNRYTYQLANFNTSYSDFGVAFWQNSLVFTSATPVKGFYKDENTFDGQPFFSLFSLEGEKMRRLKDLSNRFHVSNAVFTKDGNVAYFTQNNIVKEKAEKNQTAITNLKLYKASYVDGKWTNLSELPFNSNDYNCAHPALSSDETVLYFASDMPGTLGASDIYKVSIHNNHSTYGAPTNLGAPVNTEGKESFPFVSKDNVLYFASEGHLGLGGLDLFQYPLESKEAVVENLGPGVNTAFDEFGMYIKEDLKSGYFSSNRPNGVGNDDIYEITDITPLKKYEQKFYGKVFEKLADVGVPNAKVTVFNDDFVPLQSVNTKPDGSYDDLVIGGNPGDVVFIRAEHPDFITDEIRVILPEKAGEKKVNIVLDKKIIEVKKGDDLAKVFDIENIIYFDFNKSEINKGAEVELAKVLEVMKLYPEMKIDVRSHTDSRGTNEYNQKLSDHRAKSTVDWLVANGIQNSRLTGNGYGETKLVNHCSDGVECTDEVHQKNRRSEFIISEL